MGARGQFLGEVGIERRGVILRARTQQQALEQGAVVVDLFDGLVCFGRQFFQNPFAVEQAAGHERVQNRKVDQVALHGRLAAVACRPLRAVTDRTDGVQVEAGGDVAAVSLRVDVGEGQIGQIKISHVLADDD